jgi:hypothetical protein
MTGIADVCLLIDVSALAVSSGAWYMRLAPGEFRAAIDEKSRQYRDCIALSGLLCVTFSSVVYLVTLLLWANHSFNSRGTTGTWVIIGGLITAVWAVLGGLFARALERPIILVGSAAMIVLWMLAGAAGAAV